MSNFSKEDVQLFESAGIAVVHATSPSGLHNGEAYTITTRLCTVAELVKFCVHERAQTVSLYTKNGEMKRFQIVEYHPK